MNLNTYKTLTGLDVSTTNQGFVTANIARTQSMLEVLLGFTLDSEKVGENKYTELGQSNEFCVCPNFNIDNLQPADAVTGAYRLYSYNTDDKYLHIDPASEIYNVKLVYITNRANGEGITVKKFDSDTITVQFNNDKFTTYINNLCRSLCDSDANQVQLAVDAKWLWDGSLPSDLQYVWADMITYYSNKKRNIKSESIDTHSYTLADVKAPQNEDYNIAILKKYAGPNGSITRRVV